MIRSMTGYARHEQATASGRLVWELRAVNHRYLDVQFKLPDDLRAIENELRTRVTGKVARGKFEVALRHVRDAASVHALDVDTERLHALNVAMSLVAKELSLSTAPDPLRVLGWPGVVRAGNDAVSAPDSADALAAFECALVDFNAMRSREGERLRGYLIERLETMAALVQQVRARAPSVRDAWIERLRQKCRDLGVDVDPARLAQELALQSQRLDVDEELSRLDSHFVEIRDTLVRDEAVGRRLDFLMQELNREANTLGSKSQDAEMTRCAVEMKVLIEQMREQVQNIE